MSSRNSGVYFPRGDENREYVKPWKGLGTFNIPKKKRGSQLLQQLLPTTSAHFLQSSLAGCSHILLCILHNLDKSLS